MSLNPNIYELDYNAIKERQLIYLEDLVKYLYHPKRILYFIKKYNYDINSHNYIVVK